MTPVMNWELRLSQSYGGMLIRLTFSDSCDNIRITEAKKNAASETPCKYDTTCPWYKKRAHNSSPVTTNALVKIECARNSIGQGTHC